MYLRTDVHPGKKVLRYPSSWNVNHHELCKENLVYRKCSLFCQLVENLKLLTATVTISQTIVKSINLAAIY